MLLGAQNTMLQFMNLYGLGGPYYDIISKYRSNKAQILIFIKIAICRALEWGVDSATYWGTPRGYLSLGGG